MLNLCELLLDELKAFGQQEVFLEVSSLINQIYNLAQHTTSFPLIVDALILQAKFAMVEGNLIAAENFLVQASITVEEKNLGLLQEKTELEKNRLKEQLESWQKLIQDNRPIKERLEKAQLEEYISAALNLASYSKKKRARESV